MTSFAWLLLLVIFVQPLYYAGRAIFAKVNGKEDQFVQYWANFKSWLLALWDLLKWKVR